MQAFVFNLSYNNFTLYKGIEKTFHVVTAAYKAT